MAAAAAAAAPALPTGWGGGGTLREKGKLKHLSAGGEFVVYTPWYPEGVLQHDVLLEDEMRRFARFILLSTAERRAVLRGALPTALRAAAAAVWPGAAVTPVGALALDCITTGRPVQFAVEHCGPLGAGEGVAEVLRRLRDAGLRVDAPHAPGDVTSGAFVSVADPSPDNALAPCCDVSFHPGDSPAGRSVPIVRQWLAEFPAARPAYVVLFYFLEQTKCVGRGVGGITHKALLLMVLHVCRLLRAQQAPDVTPEFVLRRCLAYYGRELDFQVWAVDPHALDPVRKQEFCSDAVVVLDPAAPEVNVAADCVRMHQIRMQLQYCEAVLARAGKPRGRRGRTPLSAVVSYDSLWERRRQVDARAQGGAGGSAGSPGCTDSDTDNLPSAADYYSDNEVPPQLLDPADVEEP